MKHILALTVRGIKIFIRNRTTVFFSLLSSLILVALYILFIGKMFTTGIPEAVNYMLGTKELNFIVYIQMMCGVIILNSVSLSTGVFSLVATDFEEKRTDSFLLTRATPMQIITSFFLTAFLTSIILNMITWIFSVVVIGFFTGYWLTITTLLNCVMIILFSSFISCAVMLLLTNIVRSSSTIGIITGIIGTFLGFLCGLYVPFESLGSFVMKVGSCLPWTHLAIWYKQVALKDVFKQVGIPETYHEQILNQTFSAGNIGFAGIDVPLAGMLIISVIIALFCLAIAAAIMKTRFRS